MVPEAVRSLHLTMESSEWEKIVHGLQHKHLGILLLVGQVLQQHGLGDPASRSRENLIIAALVCLQEWAETTIDIGGSDFRLTLEDVDDRFALDFFIHPYSIQRIRMSLCKCINSWGISKFWHGVCSLQNCRIVYMCECITNPLHIRSV